MSSRLVARPSRRSYLRGREGASRAVLNTPEASPARPDGTAAEPGGQRDGQPGGDDGAEAEGGGGGTGGGVLSARVHDTGGSRRAVQETRGRSVMYVSG